MREIGGEIIGDAVGEIVLLLALSRELNLAAHSLAVPVVAHAAVAARHVWKASFRRTRSAREM
jgi:hypothetical protein